MKLNPPKRLQRIEENDTKKHTKREGIRVLWHNRALSYEESSDTIIQTETREREREREEKSREKIGKKVCD